MQKFYFLAAVIFIAFVFMSCSKRYHPSRTAMNNNATIEVRKGVEAETNVNKNKTTTSPTPAAPVVVKKEVVKPKAVDEFPKVISVNDDAARKSVDGRLYYDVMGHRYWRNNKDGKYYLFNKSMYNDPDFQK